MKLSRFIVTNALTSSNGDPRFYIILRRFGVIVDKSCILNIRQVKIICQDLWEKGYKVRLNWDITNQELRDFFREHRKSKNLPIVTVGKVPPPPFRKKD